MFKEVELVSQTKCFVGFHPAGTSRGSESMPKLQLNAPQPNLQENIMDQ